MQKRHECEAEHGDIPNICHQTFVSISKTLKSLWIVGIVLILPATIASVTWAGKTTLQQTKCEASLEGVEGDIADLKKVNDKLDIIISKLAERDDPRRRR